MIDSTIIDELRARIAALERLTDTAADVTTRGDRALTHSFEPSTWTLADFPEYDIPAALQPGLERYLKDHIRPGHFLCAILENNLSDAVLRAADAATAHAIPRIVRFLTYEACGTAHGSPAAVEAWLAERRTP
jgi:hypothetical protein